MIDPELTKLLSLKTESQERQDKDRKEKDEKCLP